MSEPGAPEGMPQPAAADPAPESVADRTARNIQQGIEKGRRQQELEKTGLVFEKMPKSVFLGLSDDDRKAKFVDLSGNAQDYLLEQFNDEERAALFSSLFVDDEERAAIEKTIDMRKKLKERLQEAADPDNGKDLGERQDLVAPDIDDEGKEFVHSLDKLLEEAKNGGELKIEAVKPLLKGMTKDDAIKLLKARDITDQGTLDALTADLVNVDDLITRGRTQNGGLNNVEALKPLLKGMTKKDAMRLLSEKNITDPGTLAALTDDLTDDDEARKEKDEEMKGTNEVWKREMLAADDKLEKMKEENPDKAEEINALQRKIRNFSVKFKDYFAEGEPGREYARKGKKWLYYLLVTTIVLLLMECSLIYKAAAGRKR